MKLNYETTDKEKSQVSLKITVDKEEIKNEYEKLISDVQEKAEIKGFRKGKVPRSVLESKFKEGFLADVASKIIDDAFKEAIEKVDKKPIAYSMPRLENFQVPVLENDYTFELIYDVFPKIKISDFKKIEAETNEIKISEDDVKAEIEKYQKEFSTIKPKEGSIGDTDIVNIEYTVNFDGKEFYKNENEYIYMDKSYDMFKLGEDIKGLKKGDEKNFSKTFPKDEIEKLADKTFDIKLKIKEVKEEVKPELNDDFAKQVNEKFDTLEKLKQNIMEELEKYAENLAKQKVIDTIFDKLCDTFEGDIPQSMIDEQKELFYRNIVNNFGGNEKKVEQYLKMQNQTKESYKNQMEEPATKEIKRGLIIQDIIRNENINISDDDVKEYIKPFITDNSKNIDEIIDNYKKNRQYEMIKEEIEIKKAIDHIYNNAKIKKGKKLTLEEFNKQGTDKQGTNKKKK